MIKLSEVEQLLFKIEISEGNIKEYDIIDLVISLKNLLNFDSGQIDVDAVLNSIEKIKDIFGIPEMTSSQAVNMVKEAAKFFCEEFSEVEEILVDDVKKKDLKQTQNSVDSTDGHQTQ